MCIYCVPPGGKGGSDGGNYWPVIIGASRSIFPTLRLCRAAQATAQHHRPPDTRLAPAPRPAVLSALPLPGYVLVLKGAIFVMVTMLALFSQLMASRCNSFRIGIIAGANTLGKAEGARPVKLP